MGRDVKMVRKCNICGREYSERPALDRRDNKTFICPDCGVRQALAGLGVDADEQERILAIIRKYTKGEDDKHGEDGKAIDGV